MTALPEVRGSLLPNERSKSRLRSDFTRNGKRPPCIFVTNPKSHSTPWSWPRGVFGWRACRMKRAPFSESCAAHAKEPFPAPNPSLVSSPIRCRSRSHSGRHFHGRLVARVRQELLALRPLEHCSLGDIAQWTGLEPGADGPPSVINFMRQATADRLRGTGSPRERQRVSLRQTNDVPLMVNAHESPQLQIQITTRRSWSAPRPPRPAARGTERGPSRDCVRADANAWSSRSARARGRKRFSRSAERGPRRDFPSRRHTN